MKKLILITGMVIGMTFLVSSVNSQTTQSSEKAPKVQTTQTSQPATGNFVDKNGDGICDNHQTRGKQANCAKFIDKNGDGVCDNCKGNGNCGQGNCCGKGMKKGDCPNMNKGNCCGKGMGHQHRNGQNNCPKTTPTQPEKK